MWLPRKQTGTCGATLRTNWRDWSTELRCAATEDASANHLPLQTTCWSQTPENSEGDLIHWTVQAAMIKLMQQEGRRREAEAE